MSRPPYTTEILRLAASLPEMRELEREDGRAELRSPTCGSRIEIVVQLDRDRRIQMISQQVHACAFGQASAALVQQHAVGRAHDEVADALVAISRWLAEEQDETGEWPGIAALEPARPRKGRHGAILLPFRALLAAIESAR
ncbi:MAG TPA: iron-sulfur cluster assembly scaffold protein [Sphingomicrobium sp.]|jgi:NifU-like protein involved in Fe-S cluster formation|nr:iron-sulfur cluster assembly scaffold protein [Sphingomicrobium sp.]